MNVFKTAVVLGLTLAMAGSGVAEDAAKGKGKGKPGADRKAPSVTAQILGDIELSAEQKEKAAAIDKEFAGKAEELRKQQLSILTEDQIAAQREAGKKAKESGATPADARKAIDAALSLSDDQKAKMAEHRKASGELRQAVMAKLADVLTEEQKAKLKKPARGKKPGEKKPGEKKPGDGAKKKAARE